MCTTRSELHLPGNSHLVAEAHEAADVDMQAVQRDGGRHEVVVQEGVDVKVACCNLRVLSKEAELVATLHSTCMFMLHVLPFCFLLTNLYSRTSVSHQWHA
jgi:hypothetical protein